METILRIIVPSCRQHLVPSPRRREEVDADVTTASVLEADGQSRVFKFADFFVRAFASDGIDGDGKRPACRNFSAKAK